MIEIKILINSTEEERQLIFNSVLPEGIDTKYIRIDKENSEIIIKAPTISRGRAIMNSYISWIYTILETIKRVNKDDRENSP
ncbi:KEOPS complex subunit Pcc1 [Sulfurisphaera ohwakuensis]|uniref:tRNA threonylcarbamoyladenosine modification (KEOPS) complex Pcc1 subunit n=1 Tax=Sulfurisphaera ohwakuensis TaxID=69656 RepID=A0A650CE06_SULOH|nr:KEOPS complex subunit Pcc1 [Sulfurisphaera ohwakuensis]MBB5252980.1 tRNA threonylcarbamoyladenosine modification (KEOPS) complex Pcc1 subunit [Sulfurisphaera ohwakuensis]QGR16093.1 hypothetical protein D1869_01985 [Sulfurisphaera ohwakuensis]